MDVKKVKNFLKVSFLAAGLAFILSQSAAFSNCRAVEKPKDLEQLARCLNYTGAKFYGTEGCGWCDKQKEMFGEAAKYLPYVDCDADDNPCSGEGIIYFPTWKFSNGKVLKGMQDLEDLAKESNCKY